jgi:acetate kinase
MGERSSYIRERILAEFDYLGLSVDGQANDQNAQIVSAQGSKVLAMVVPTDEELVIAQETRAIAEHATIS